ncbi:putative RNA-dependent RNA polymerase 5 [Morella rubra]|uniref:RNA-dependent RNA polymerase n=1 Tax=Morella rubra TaxID=262757 RepID=A0A6A1VW25_9ROSI|nr:putative RNA-dependent RNA polymerase 5 [Morella rubra]
MHAHGLPSVASYMARFSLILSKTMKLEVDLASVNIERIEDVFCTGSDGNVVYDKGGKHRIHTDGTGFISEDLALHCPSNLYKGEKIKDEPIERNPNLDEVAGKLSAMKGLESNTREPPLLIQFRLFNNGFAVKGTFLVNKKLPPRTIQVRPSMIKVWMDPELSDVRTQNSLEIVGTSNQPKRTYLSRPLIALLSYGGVPREYFMDILLNALRDAQGAFSNKRAALRAMVRWMIYSVARMILSGIPLDESFLQYRLSKLMDEEKKSLKSGKLHVPECFYLMGTADPTGVLESDEVCVIWLKAFEIIRKEKETIKLLDNYLKKNYIPTAILYLKSRSDNGQISGKVLVYRNPGLHFGDIHILKATYVKALEPIIGNAKYAIFFPCKGPRSLADEIAGGDFDGDMYWVSRNPQLLEYFKESEPWSPTSSVHDMPNHDVPMRKPSDFSAAELEEELFKLFLTTRFQPSYSKSVAADSWLALMDRFLILEDDCIEEKAHVKANILQLIDIYYDALDAPKKGGRKSIASTEENQSHPVNENRSSRRIEGRNVSTLYGRENSFTSTSVLGSIYDTVSSYQAEDPSMKEVGKLPCFDVEVPKVCLDKWKELYDQYRQEMRTALQQGPEGKNEAADEVIKKYKMILYGAAEFEESKRVMEEIFNEALAIYHITYDYAKTRSASYCGFAWKVAGSALIQLYAKKGEGKDAIRALSDRREKGGIEEKEEEEKLRTYDVTRAIIVNDNNTMGFEDAKSYVKFPLPTRILEVYLKRSDTES